MAKKKPPHKATKKVCFAMTYRIVCDSGTLATTVIPLAQNALGISIDSPANGGTVNNPVKASGQVFNGGNPCQATVTVWVTDQWGHCTYGSVTGPDANGNWSATFPTLAAGPYSMSAQAQWDKQSASTSISITVK